jgi:hypothetical protein
MQRAILKLDEVRRRRLSARVPQLWFIWTARPVVELVLIAARAAVDQVVDPIIAALAQRLEVVDSKLAAHISLADAAKLTGEIGAMLYLTADVA